MSGFRKLERLPGQSLIIRLAVKTVHDYAYDTYIVRGTYSIVLLFRCI